MNPFILLAIGFLMIFIEFYLPGAILGTVGGVLILLSLILFASQTDSALAVILYTVATAVGLGFLIKYALWKIRHTRPDYSIYSSDAQNGYQASEYDHSAIGKTGIVQSDLKPGGYILIDGVQHQALSQAGYLVKGSEVIVIGGQEESLIVKQRKTHE